MKNIIIALMLVVFVTLFIRLSIFDDGFLLGTKKQIAFDNPLYIVEYKSSKTNILRGLESGIVLLSLVSEFNFIIIGKSNKEWLFFDTVNTLSNDEDTH